MTRQTYDDSYEPRPDDLLEIAKTIAGPEPEAADAEPDCLDCADLPDGWACAECYINGRADVTAGGYE